MGPVLRALLMYVLLLLAFRLSGKRTLADVTTFDFVLLLIIGEATQQALLGNDFSITNAFVVITTLILADIGFALWKRHSATADRIIDDLPLVICEHGKPIEERLREAEVDEEDILAAARHLHGLERMNQIRYAVLERNGGISIIPEKS
jgi:uncharacterized membrane protein YcaP (DUF421 family)